MIESPGIDQSFWFLRDHRFFREISNKDLKQLCVIVGFRKAKKGEIFFLSDVAEPRIYFLKKGAIKIVNTNDEGEEVIHHILRRGDIFGQMESQNAQPTNEYAVALTKRIVICSFLKEDFEHLMLKKPELALRYSKFVGLSYKRIANNYNNLFFKSAKSRLAGFITEMAESEGEEVEEGIEFENYLTHVDLSRIVCISRQTCTSILNSFKRDDLLQYDRKKWIIKDLDSLRTLSQL
ncbi:MAG: Crp/Fnr family transcriptional regulator [Bacteroidota bacterium]